MDILEVMEMAEKRFQLSDTFLRIRKEDLEYGIFLFGVSIFL